MILPDIIIQYIVTPGLLILTFGIVIFLGYKFFIEPIDKFKDKE